MHAAMHEVGHPARTHLFVCLNFQCALHAAAAKFTGSGGAIVAFCPNGQQQENQLQAACQAKGFTAVRAEIGPVLHELSSDDVDIYMREQGLVDSGLLNPQPAILMA